MAAKEGRKEAAWYLFISEGSEEIEGKRPYICLPWSEAARRKKKNRRGKYLWALGRKACSICNIYCLAYLNAVSKLIIREKKSGGGNLLSGISQKRRKPAKKTSAGIMKISSSIYGVAAAARAALNLAACRMLAWHEGEEEEEEWGVKILYKIHIHRLNIHHL